MWMLRSKCPTKPVGSDVTHQEEKFFTGLITKPQRCFCWMCNSVWCRLHISVWVCWWNPKIKGWPSDCVSLFLSTQTPTWWEAAVTETNHLCLREEMDENFTVKSRILPQHWRENVQTCCCTITHSVSRSLYDSWAPKPSNMLWTNNMLKSYRTAEKQPLLKWSLSRDIHGNDCAFAFLHGITHTIHGNM